MHHLPLVERQQLERPGLAGQQAHSVLVAATVLDRRQRIVRQLDQAIGQALPGAPLAQLADHRPEAVAELLQDDPDGVRSIAQLEQRGARLHSDRDQVAVGRRQER